MPQSALLPELVDVVAIAEMAGTTPGMVHNWRYRNSGFPDPDVLLAIGPIWLRSRIETWLASRKPGGWPAGKPRRRSS